MSASCHAAASARGAPAPTGELGGSTCIGSSPPSAERTPVPRPTWAAKAAGARPSPPPLAPRPPGTAPIPVPVSSSMGYTPCLGANAQAGPTDPMGSCAGITSILAGKDPMENCLGNLRSVGSSGGHATHATTMSDLPIPLAGLKAAMCSEATRGTASSDKTYPAHPNRTSVRPVSAYMGVRPITLTVAWPGGRSLGTARTGSRTLAGRPPLGPSTCTSKPSPDRHLAASVTTSMPTASSSSAE